MRENERLTKYETDFHEWVFEQAQRLRLGEPVDVEKRGGGTGDVGAIRRAGTDEPAGRPAAQVRALAGMPPRDRGRIGIAHSVRQLRLEARVLIEKPPDSPALFFDCGVPATFTSKPLWTDFYGIH